MPRKTLNTLGQLRDGIPKPSTIYKDLSISPGWNYKNDSTRERFQCRDRALASLLYLGCLRVSEALRLVKSQFQDKENYILVSQIRLSKRRPGNIKYREARLPLTGTRACFTKLILEYLEMLTAEERLFPWSLKERKYIVKGHPYCLRSGQNKDRISVQISGTKRAYQIVHALLPEWTEHWLRAFGESYLYDTWDHDIVAVADQVKVDTRTVEKYLVNRSSQYRAV